LADGFGGTIDETDSRTRMGLGDEKCAAQTTAKMGLVVISDQRTLNTFGS
jgi:hypothetical protein